MLTGGCLCQAVRYEAHGTPFHSTLCHCGLCRRSTGAPSVAWFSVARADFRLVQGELTRHRSSTHSERAFCPRCGTQLTFTSDGAPDEIDITTASLDDPAQMPPTDHTWASRRLAWLPLCNGLPEHAEARAPQAATAPAATDSRDADLPALPCLPPGRYRHHKGQDYEVLGVVRHSETLAPLVLYRPLYGERRLWVRPHAMFVQEVEVDGRRMPRFQRQGAGG